MLINLYRLIFSLSAQQIKINILTKYNLVLSIKIFMRKKSETSNFSIDSSSSNDILNQSISKLDKQIKKFALRTCQHSSSSSDIQINSKESKRNSRNNNSSERKNVQHFYVQPNYLKNYPKNNIQKSRNITFRQKQPKKNHFLPRYIQRDQNNQQNYQRKRKIFNERILRKKQKKLSSEKEQFGEKSKVSLQESQTQTLVTNSKGKPKEVSWKKYYGFVQSHPVKQSPATKKVILVSKYSVKGQNAVNKTTFLLNKQNSQDQKRKKSKQSQPNKNKKQISQRQNLQKLLKQEKPPKDLKLKTEQSIQKIPSLRQSQKDGKKKSINQTQILFQNQQLQKQLLVQKGIISNLQKKLKQKDQQLRALRHQRKSLNSQNQCLTQEIYEKRGGIVKLEFQMNYQKKVINFYEKQNQKFDKQINQQKQKIKEYEIIKKANKESQERKIQKEIDFVEQDSNKMFKFSMQKYESLNYQKNQPQLLPFIQNSNELLRLRIENKYFKKEVAKSNERLNEIELKQQNNREKICDLSAKNMQLHLWIENVVNKYNIKI